MPATLWLAPLRLVALRLLLVHGTREPLNSIAALYQSCAVYAEYDV